MGDTNTLPGGPFYHYTLGWDRSTSFLQLSLPAPAGTPQAPYLIPGTLKTFLKGLKRYSMYLGAGLAYHQPGLKPLALLWSLNTEPGVSLNTEWSLNTFERGSPKTT